MSPWLDILRGSETGEYLRLANSWALLMLLLIPVVLWAGHALRKQRPPTVTFPALRLVRAAVGGSGASAPILPGFFRALLLTAIVLGIARPQYGRVERQAYSEGIDIMVVLDVSLSMRAQDFFPDRLTAAKTVTRDFVKGRNGDQIGIVIFGSEAVTLVPLTLDYSVLTSFIDRIRFNIVDGNATAIGMGLSTALARLKESEGESKVVVLLTDGENNAGKVDPLMAAEAARAMGVRVYTIGVGSDMRGMGFFGVRSMDAGFDSTLLSRMAEMTGGQYFEANDNAKLTEIYRQIDRMEKKSIESSQFDNFRELTPYLSALGLLFLLGEITLRSTRYLRWP